MGDPDFIQEIVRRLRLRTALLALVAPVKRGLVTEKFALEERLRNGGAVDGMKAFSRRPLL